MNLRNEHAFYQKFVVLIAFLVNSMSVCETEYGDILRGIYRAFMAGILAHCSVLFPTFSDDSGLMFISIRIPNGYENNNPLLSESVGNEAQWILSH
jgi:uncharacterized membrane protein